MVVFAGGGSFVRLSCWLGVGIGSFLPRFPYLSPKPGGKHDFAKARCKSIVFLSRKTRFQQRTQQRIDPKNPDCHAQRTRQFQQ